MKIICTICMRANSQEVKNKNLKIINKKPLMYFTIKSAIKSKLFDKIVVSSDSKKIQSLSKKFGAEVIFTRPKRLSSKYVPMSTKKDSYPSTLWIGTISHYASKTEATSPSRIPGNTANTPFLSLH